MMAVCRVRRSTLRSARPLASASGSGSLCRRISTRSASLKNRWYCCTLQPGQRSAELGQQRAAEQLRERQVVQLRELRLELLFPFSEVGDADAEHVDQRAARIADGFEHLAEAAAPVVFDDDAGAGREIGFEVGVGAARVGRGDVHARFVEAAGEGLALDEELDLEAGQQDFVQHPDDQLGLTDGQAPHRIDQSRRRRNLRHRLELLIIRPAVRLDYRV